LGCYWAPRWCRQLFERNLQAFEKRWDFYFFYNLYW
jgi:hypothetical protein